MYEMVKLLGNTYYINCPAKMGLYVDEKKSEAYLIDTGNDSSAGRKVQKLLDANGWKLKAIICTHSHADHIGGNKLLQDRCGCITYTTMVERAFVEFPLFESAFLYGGFPPRELRNKFLFAQASCASDISELELPEGMKYFDLPGHSFSMLGIMTPDKVCFVADAIVSGDVLEKYHVSYMYDVKGYLQTLDFLESLEAELYVPAHATPAKDMGELIELNRQKVAEVAALVEKLCTGATPDDVIKAVFDHYALKMDFNQYALVGSTVKSYLSYLSDAGRIAPSFEDNRLRWTQTTQSGSV